MAEIIIVTYTYNRPNLLPRTVESVLAQTFGDFEYLIINNGSSDNETPKLLEKCRSLDKRISVITRPYNDVSTKYFIDLQNLLKKNRSRYFMQVDDDDYMEPGSVELLYKMITENDADIATVGSMWVYPDGKSKNKYVFDGKFIYSRIEAMNELLKREKFNSAQGGKLYRKSLFENITLPHFDHFRDIHREYRVINNVRKIVVTGKPKYYFYRHGNNASGLDTKEQITPEKMKQHLEANTIRTKWLSENMPEIKDFVFYCELSFMISLYDRIYRLQVESCYNIAKEMRDTLLKHNSFLIECDFCTDKENEILKLM